MLRDARRFVQSHTWVIENYPLQVYASALVFSPTQSLIRKSFQPEKPGWIKHMPTVDLQWSACFQTLEGHSGWVRSVVFSHDGKHVASASDDETVKIWDATDRRCLRTLEGHSGSVRSVVFSHDGKHVASVSADRTVKIWDTTDRRCLQTFNVRRLLSNISFDKSGSFLQIEIRAFLLENKSAPIPKQTAVDHKELHRHNFDLSGDKKWIRRGSENVLWLPPDYRPSVSSVTASAMAVGCPTGRVFIFSFSDNLD